LIITLTRIATHDSHKHASSFLQTGAIADPSTLLLVVVGAFCLFSFAKETKNNANNEKLQITPTSLARLLCGVEEDRLLLLWLGSVADSLLLVMVL
jgi:hypothetical protein